jgi:hypothetical protein
LISHFVIAATKSSVQTISAHAFFAASLFSSETNAAILTVLPVQCGKVIVHLTI